MSKKRGTGEGSMYRRKDGRWCGVVIVGRTATGERRRRHLYGRTRAEVSEKLRKLTNDVAEGVVAEPGRLRVSDLVERFLEAKRASLRPTTLELYATALRKHVVPRMGGVLLSKLGAVHVLDLLSALERDGVGARTRQVVFDVLRRTLELGVRLSLLPRNPARDPDRPRVVAPEIASLSVVQARELLSEARNAPTFVEAAVALGLSGLRLGEVLGLAWGDADLDRGRIRVRQALVELGKGAREVSELKTKSARREFALPPFAQAALQRHRDALPAAPHPARLVFLSRTGTPFRRSNLRRRHLEPLFERAELEGTTFHSLRHTAATLLFASGADVKSAQRVLGHARAAHTLDIYADAVPDNVDAAMGRLGAVLDG